MVGTFYSSRNPESPPLVKKGDQVEAETVVCIIEAMKVFSDIQAEIKGEVVEVLVENGTPVQYGEALFIVKTS
jgi:acetyl-CoA carboxylase biotin carboxyl carrier protein